MPADIALGVTTFLLAALGGIVSAHAPRKTSHKLAYGLAFVALGAIGLFFVVQQSRETAKASADLSKAISDLSTSSSENTRIEKLNTELQKRLLKSNDDITNLARVGIDVSTGGTSICYVNFVFRGSTADLVLLQRGKYPLADVTMRFIDNDDLRTALQQPPVNIGTLPVNGSRDLTKLVMPDRSEKRFTVSFSARNGAWDQLILLRRDSEGWHFATEIEDNPGQVRFSDLNKKSKTLLVVVDPCFPGDPKKEWHSFSGQTRYCTDCKAMQ